MISLRTLLPLFFFAVFFTLTQASILSDILKEPEPKTLEEYWITRMKYFGAILNDVPEWVVKDITASISSSDLASIAIKEFPLVVQAYFTGKHLYDNLYELITTAYATPFSDIFALKELSVAEFNDSVDRVFEKVFENIENIDIHKISNELEQLYERTLITPKSQFSANRGNEINKNLRKLKKMVEEAISNGEKTQDKHPRIEPENAEVVRGKIRDLFILIAGNFENVDKFFGSFITSRKSGEKKLLNAMAHMILLAESSTESISSEKELTTAQKKFAVFSMVYRKVLEYDDISCAMDKLTLIKDYIMEAYNRSKQFYGMKKGIFQKSFFMAAAGEIDHQIFILKRTMKNSSNIF